MKQPLPFSSLVLWGLLAAFSTASAQMLENPSFAGEPGSGETPNHWFSCHPLSTPDTGPNRQGAPGPAHDGYCYLALVSRGDLSAEGLPEYTGTMEDVSARLRHPLRPNRSYRMELWLSYNPNFLFNSLARPDPLRYGEPLQLTLMGSADSCGAAEPLWVSPVIDHADWQRYEATFTPQGGPYRYFRLQATLVGSDPYFGNIFVDGMQFLDTETRLKFPNVFTPNGDGANDQLAPYDYGALYGYELQVFDRWGRLVFRSRQPENGWEGLIEGRPAPIGPYFYHLVYEDIAGTPFRQQGSVSLLR